jgi:hypothetical protein
VPSSRAPVAPSTPIGARLVGLLGMALIIGIGYALSSNRKAIRWQTVAWGLGLQILFAIFVLRVPFGRELFRALGAFVTSVLHYSYVGSSFVFGELGKPDSSLGVIFAFQILPAIIFVSGALRDHVLPGRDAAGGARVRGGDEQDHAGQLARRAWTWRHRSSWDRPRRR